MIERILNALEVTPEDMRHGVESPAEAALTGLLYLGLPVALLIIGSFVAAGVK